VILTELFVQFFLISLLAFGGGQAALPLMEQVCVTQMGWVSPQVFTAAVAFGYITPGPVLITASFIGYVAAGLLGAVAATIGVFLAPILLTVLMAIGVEQLAGNRWLRAFGRGAAPAVVGLLAATTGTLAQSTLTSWSLVVVAFSVFILAAITKIQPVLLLAGGALASWILNIF
jgi:chromate transporter